MICKRTVPAIILVAFLVVGLAGCTGGTRRPKEPEKPFSKVAVPKKIPLDSTLKSEFQKARITWDDDKGRRILEAEFKEAVASQTGDNAVAEILGVKAIFYKDGKIASSIIAPRIVADSQKKEVRASGGVKIASAVFDSGAQAERVTWKSSENKVYGEGAVKMTRGNMTIVANSFIADTALEKARFTSARLSVE